MIGGVFEVPGSLLSWLYTLSNSYGIAIGMIAGLVMLLVTPLILKSTKGMLEMQRLAPQMRKLQNEHRGDRQKLNEEMMKLYQEHKVNPMASCLPMVAQMPVFFIMFRILTGMTYRPTDGNRRVAEAVFSAAGDTGDIGFFPRYLSTTSDLYRSLVRAEEMSSFGLDLSLSPSEMLGQDFTRGLIYAALVAFLGALYFVQQRMVAARAAISPTMSASQQKMMQYLPVVFAVFQIFFLLALVVYYIVQSFLRIAQQVYITKRFYGGDQSLGRQAQAASEQARELSKKDGGGGGSFAQARRDLSDAKGGGAKSGSRPDPRSKTSRKKQPEPTVSPSKRTTAPKNRPTPTAKKTVDRAGKNRPTPSKRPKRK
ncbi:MAG: YidC/Oxa1 family membrane protein insertase [Myxococcota bacterium]|jgi:YidC/Oxa1 family membrane protein insertase